jgi:hypothetical protein
LHRRQRNDAICVNDLLLRPRAPMPMPDTYAMTDPSAALAFALRQEVETLRKEIEALQASTCWRATAPLRAIARSVHRQRDRG